MSAFSLDTNILIYAIDTSQNAKHTAAQALLEQALNAAWPIAMQVLGEFYSATVRKKVLTRASAVRTVKLWGELMRPCAVSPAGFNHALGYSSSLMLSKPFYVPTISIAGTFFWTLAAKSCRMIS